MIMLYYTADHLLAFGQHAVPRRSGVDVYQLWQPCTHLPVYRPLLQANPNVRVHHWHAEWTETVFDSSFW